MNNCNYTPYYHASKCTATPVYFTLEMIFDILKGKQINFREEVVIEELKRKDCREITGIAIAGWGYYFDDYGNHVKLDFKDKDIYYPRRVKIEFDTYGTYSNFLII